MHFINKQYFLSVVILLLLFTSGCKTSEQLIDGETFHCQGNSPFWKADVNNDEITFEITGGAKEVFPAVPSVENDGLKIFVTYIEKGGNKVWLKIKLKEGSCQTSAAGKTFPYKVEVERGEKIFYGCGE